MVDSAQCIERPEKGSGLNDSWCSLCTLHSTTLGHMIIRVASDVPSVLELIKCTDAADCDFHQAKPLVEPGCVKEPVGPVEVSIAPHVHQGDCHKVAWVGSDYDFHIPCP